MFGSLSFMHHGDSALSLKRNMLWNSVGSVFYQGCIWLITVLVVRLSDDFLNSGYLALAMSVGNVMFALGSYNMRTFQVSDVRERFSDGTYIGLRLFTDCIALLICIAYSVLVCQSAYSLFITISFLIFKFDEAFVNVLYGIEQKHMRLDAVGGSMMIRGAVFVFIFSIIMYFTQTLLYAICGMAVCGMVITLLFDLRIQKAITHRMVLPKLSASDCRYLLVTCFPSVAALVVSTLIVSFARQYFSLAYGELDLGIYASVATPCVIIQVLAQNIYLPLLGPLAHSYAESDVGAVSRRTLLSFGVVAGIGAVVSVVLSLLANPLLVTLYGDSIAPYAWLLCPVLVVSTFAACLGLMTDLLIVFKRLNLTLVLNLVALVLTLVALPFTCEIWYMNGINIALIIGFGASLAFGALCLKSIIGK